VLKFKSHCQGLRNLKLKALNSDHLPILQDETRVEISRRKIAEVKNLFNG